MNRLCAVIVFYLIVTTTVSIDAEEYVSIEELEEEITNRREDIARTEYRLSTIQKAEIAAEEELARSRDHGADIEHQVIIRAKALYRMSRNGGTLRYLFGASSPVDLLKRLSELRRLLTQGLEARRQAGHRMVQAERRVESLAEEKKAAFQMKAMLTEALADLETQKASLFAR
jgi:septal ring factor EnvC (AmiA/AmiB activator)